MGREGQYRPCHSIDLSTVIFTVHLSRISQTATSDKPRALLLTKDKKVPLLWKVLGNKYQGQLEFATHRDRKGKSSVILGYEAGEKKAAKVFIYPVGSKQAVRYEGSPYSHLNYTCFSQS